MRGNISILLLCTLSLNPVFAMQLLEDDDMAVVTGQAGITIETDSLGWSAGNIEYQDDGQNIQLQGVSIAPVGGQSTYRTVMTADVASDGQLQLDIQAGERQFQISEIIMDGSNRSFGRLIGSYSYDADFRLKGLPEGGLDLSGSEVDLRMSRLYWRDNGLDWIMDGIRSYIGVDRGVLTYDNNGLFLDFGDANDRGLRLIFELAGVGLDPTHSGGGSVDFGTPLSQSFGNLYLNLQAYGSVRLAGGGATGQGITFVPQLTLINDDDNVPAFRYTDDGNLLLARNFSGTYSTVSGFTIDLRNDIRGPFVDVQFADFDFAFNLEDAVLGGTDPLANTIGSFGGEFHFRNDVANNRYNYFQLLPGGDDPAAGFGNKGITIDTAWNIVSDPYDISEGFAKPGALNTYVAVNDDGNYVVFNGFNSHGSGRVTLDMTSRLDPTVGRPGTRSVFASDYDGHFDGLRIGFKDVRGSYSFSGVTVGRSQSEALDSALMGGTELLLSLEVFPAYDFTLNGHVTVRPGNVHSGGQGITLNSDLFITDANAALTVDENGRGVWLTNTRYDMHMRDSSVDITDDGLTFFKGLSWSTIDIGDIKFGDKVNGQSLGSFRLDRLEDGTTISVASGGAGQVCIGGSGSTAAACSASGGRFEDRGEQGLTVKLNGKFVEAGSADPRYAGKSNSFTWTQTNGTKIALENFSTRDGSASTNNYGLNVDLSIDVAETVVLDENRNPVQVNGQDPLGFAVLGRVHFKQLNIDNLTLTGSGVNAVPQTLLSGVVIQNANITTNLTATPIR